MHEVVVNFVVVVFVVVVVFCVFVFLLLLLLLFVFSPKTSKRYKTILAYVHKDYRRYMGLQAEVCLRIDRILHQ